MTVKILSIIDSGIIGGPGRGVFQFILHSPESRCKIILANFKYKNPKSTEFIDVVKTLAFPLVLLTQRFRFDPQPFAEIGEIIKRENISLIETHGYKGHFLGWYAARRYGVKWAAWAHGWTSEDLKVRIYHALDRLTLSHADLAIGVSTPLYNKIKSFRKAGKKTALILNAVDLSLVTGGDDPLTVRRRYNIDSQDILIGTFGRLSSEKGQIVLIKAFAQIAEKFPKVKLILVGDGPDRGLLEETVKQLKLSARVVFAGYQKEIRPFYKAIQFMVLPSLSEGLPNVVLEAMGFAIPVVMTAVGELPEFVEHRKNGWIVQKNSVELLAEAISEALQSEDLRRTVARNAKSMVDERFSAAARSHAILDLYDQLLK
jgi:glycosyltransferase involved in cell wall biosynthesis